MPSLLNQFNTLSTVWGMGLSDPELRVIENTVRWELERLASSRSRTVTVKLRGLPPELRRVAKRALVLLFRRHRIPFTVQYRGWRVIFDVDDTRKVKGMLDELMAEVEYAVRSVAKGRVGIEQNSVIIADVE